MTEKKHNLDDLGQFTGTDGYTTWSPLFRQFVLTDGALYLAENAGAYWLMDCIASHMPKCKDVFAVAKLVKRKSDWLFTLDDGNGNVFAKQVIGYSDFPLDNITLYVGKQENVWVIMLTSEY